MVERCRLHGIQRRRSSSIAATSFMAVCSWITKAEAARAASLAILATSAFSDPTNSEIELRVSKTCTGLLESFFETQLQTSDEDEEQEETRSLADVQLELGKMQLQEALACADRALNVDFSATEERRKLLLRRAKFVEQAAKHPECIDDFLRKSETQTRCTQLWFKIAIHSLTAARETEEALKMWHRATSFSVGGRPARIRWPELIQSPTVWVPGLRSSRLWSCSNWPFLQNLETSAALILEEVKKATSSFSPAYPYLRQEGLWEDMFLYRGGVWNETLCNALPRTCRLLLPELPTKPGVPFATSYNEEVVIFRSTPGTAVAGHCGQSNSVVNLHLTLNGAEGTKLWIGGQVHSLQNGRVACFQDSFFHSVEHPKDGAEERISLVIRAMHPELEVVTYGQAKATDVVDDLQNWDTAASLKEEVKRLRKEYRKLAALANLQTEAISSETGKVVGCDGSCSASRSTVSDTWDENESNAVIK
eukprot:TRINITY_DN9625_c0_g1_i1.p1 TRINITY_DN9625_c0_g1~~TRINITY_DN9625_c0_g1_i1.p1  ORF type:complete len:479 (-),score=77.32 TRINITY_DN9625_c0_g1_i1:13-1449(-)